ncbi:MULTISPECIES: type II secretion system F family protein [unclassified Streptomyces]|uniref:type II secretion system F family protein n=1 Tax=unclassified Streptomyces TaxID=2593676 RepID=UPI001BE80BC3|nr:MULTISPECIES: type II secretion system F family protein [unclassified Streptomyces]MBT2404726.1 type II secretion system F family protein [Streptomyces sp. ISL-21]MBT2458345.1 type II secretion system F family protein [Streptomyces sp. ISL-86]MBT2612626.1 type II secretion system F family protein [Streptomyces sp. ISL-87]
MNPLILLTLGATVLACLLVVLGLHAYAAGRAQRAALIERLSATGAPAPLGRRRRFRGIDRRLRTTKLGRRIELKLGVTGLDLTPGEFFVYMLAAVIGIWLISASFLAPFFGPVAGLIGLWAANAFLNWQRARRNERFINQLPELARILANATQAGLALRTAIGMAAEELEAPAGEELARVANRLAVGHSMEEALGEIAERLPSRELVVLVSTLVLSARAGGAIVGSLRNLTVTLEQRKETRREIRTQLSQVTVTAYLVPVMGLGSLLLVDAMMPGALDRMTGAVIGQTAVLVALGLFTLGFVFIRRLSKIDV